MGTSAETSPRMMDHRALPENWWARPVGAAGAGCAGVDHGVGLPEYGEPGEEPPGNGEPDAGSPGDHEPAAGGLGDHDPAAGGLGYEEPDVAPPGDHEPDAETRA